MYDFCSLIRLYTVHTSYNVQYSSTGPRRCFARGMYVQCRYLVLVRSSSDSERRAFSKELAGGSCTIRGVQVAPGTRGSGYTIHMYYVRRTGTSIWYSGDKYSSTSYWVLVLWSSEPFWVYGYWYKYRSTVVTANLVWSNGTPSVRSPIQPVSVPCSHLKYWRWRYAYSTSTKNSYRVDYYLVHDARKSKSVSSVLFWRPKAMIYE